MQVPEFCQYYPSEECMDQTQAAYYRKVKKGLDNGEFVEVNGNISYIFVYAYRLLEKWNHTGFEDLSEYLIFLSELYSVEEKLSDYCLWWAHDCLLGLGKYEEYLEKTEPQKVFGTTTHSSNLRINIQEAAGLPADPLDILLMTGGRRTKFVIANPAIYKDRVRDVFSSYAAEHGGWFKVFANWMPERTSYQHELFCGAPLWNKPHLDLPIKAYYTAQRTDVDTIKSLARDAENEARKEMGAPEIGKGWISETLLFERVAAEFTLTEVIQHGRPSWLGRQHFDIWIPNWRIAIEYHGKQHFEPIDFFGGQEAFKRTCCVARPRAPHVARYLAVRRFRGTSLRRDPFAVPFRVSAGDPRNGTG